MTNPKPSLSLLPFSYEKIKHDTLKAQQAFWNHARLIIL